MNGKYDIEYHGSRRGTTMIPLQSYSKPPPQSNFDGLDYIEFITENVRKTNEKILLENSMPRNSLFLGDNPQRSDNLLL